MALTQHSKIMSSDIIALKNRVKAEMARRKYYGSLASLNTNFSNSANSGDQALLTHFNETIGHINYINATGISSDLIYAISAEASQLGVYENRGITSSTNDCTYLCRGLCVSKCDTTCSGCGSGCASTCSGNCSGWCEDSCDNYCADSCGGSNGCKNTCTSGCANWR